MEQVDRREDFQRRRVDRAGPRLAGLFQRVGAAGLGETWNAIAETSAVGASSGSWKVAIMT